MRTAIVHPWFLANGGAEQTVSALADLYPDADIFTLFYTRDDLPDNLRARRIFCSSLNWLPAKYAIYRYLLPLYPLLFESLDLRGYDLIITSDSCVTKGILTDQDAIQICYCHSPMRCLWDMHREYNDEMPVLARPFFTLGTHYVRQWDFSAAQRVNAFIANSHNVAERVRKFYGKQSYVIYPPVDTQKGFIATTHGDYYLSVGRLTRSKRVDLLISACNKLRRKLVIVGGGRDEKRLRSMAGPSIEFAGRVSEVELSDLYAHCRAFLFAASEDFGIVPVEAQSFGRPVIAYGKGGALETIIPYIESAYPPASGVFFREQTSEALEGAMLRFESTETKFSPYEIKKNSERFDRTVFLRELRLFAETTLNDNRIALPSQSAKTPSLVAEFTSRPEFGRANRAG